jgi:hypothetical protein
MTTDTAVTMQDLELEHAELLPSRETLCGCKGYSSYSSYSSVTQFGLVNINDSFNNNNVFIGL